MAGLDAHVGFLHEMSANKYSCAYDLLRLLNKQSVSA
ncbi:hypothetical protein HNV12_16465 [Methanococcoides sp. SA1]|nr:hypothetical protein [Methanococcoides sp. SA1]